LAFSLLNITARLFFDSLRLGAARVAWGEVSHLRELADNRGLRCGELLYYLVPHAKSNTIFMAHKSK
jgi:hypothetical protein